MKVLLSAYACEPGRGSEPHVGWHNALEAARHHQTWVVTRSNNEPSIRAALMEVPEAERPTFRYVDLPEWARSWKRGSRGARLYYVLWQLAALVAMRRLVAEHGVDVAHHVTFAVCWLPPATAFLGIPHVWGPVGGADGVPDILLPTFDFTSRLRYRARSVLLRASLYNPLLRHAARTAAWTLGTTRASAEYLHAAGARNVSVLPAIALTDTEASTLRERAHSVTTPPSLACVGRLVHSKGFSFALAALSRCGTDATLLVIGDGPEATRLHDLAKRLGISSRVRFVGALPRTDALAHLRQCDILLHPSMHDSGGMACLEALAAGMPVICLAHGGPPEIVSPECGVLVPVTREDRLIEALAEAIRRLSSSPALAEDMGKAARRRIDDRFLWGSVGERLAQLREATAVH